MSRFAALILGATVAVVVAGASAGAEETAPAAAPAPAPQPGSAAAPANAGQAPASYPSIMIWPEDIKAIEKAIEDHAHPPAEANKGGTGPGGAEDARRPRRPNIYVSAVLDFGDGNWTVWANGLRVTPDKQSPLFKIVAVHGDSVDIVVPGEGGGRFRLQPYQTWRSRERDVVEGIVP